METFKRVPRSLRLPPEMEAEIKRRAGEPGRKMPMAQWMRNVLEKALIDSGWKPVSNPSGMEP